MKLTAKIMCCGIALGWLQGVSAGEVAVSEQNGSIVLELASPPPDATQPVSAPAGMTTSAPAGMAASAPMGTANAAPPAQGAAPVARVPVKAYYEKVDRANIEKRMDSRAARTKKRSLDAEKDAAERAAKAQANPPVQQPVQDVQPDQGVQNAQ